MPAVVAMAFVLSPQVGAGWRRARRLAPRAGSVGGVLVYLGTLGLRSNVVLASARRKEGMPLLLPPFVKKKPKTFILRGQQGARGIGFSFRHELIQCSIALKK